jgi:hypothetical protein
VINTPVPGVATMIKDVSRNVQPTTFDATNRPSDQVGKAPVIQHSALMNSVARSAGTSLL